MSERLREIAYDPCAAYHDCDSYGAMLEANRQALAQLEAGNTQDVPPWSDLPTCIADTRRHISELEKLLAQDIKHPTDHARQRAIYEGWHDDM